MQKKTVFSIVTILLFVVGLFYILSNREPAKDYTSLVQCLKEKSVTFYGAFWCPHCQNQKKAFGAAAKDLPYVECSTPDGQAMTEECKAKGIEGYPTWVFADGQQVRGEVPPEELAMLAMCPQS